jgi:glycosyltransferase involved in cell wall biosynthesis
MGRRARASRDEEGAAKPSFDTSGRKPRVIHAIYWIPHYRSAIFRQLCSNPGIDFTIVAGDDSEVLSGVRIASAAETGKLRGIKWRRVESRHLKGPFLKGWEWQPETVKMVLTEDVDAVIGLGIKSVSNWLIAAICRVRGIPYIDWSIGVMGPERRLKWWMRKSYLRLAKAHLLYGGWSRNWYAAHGFSEDQLFVVRNSLDHEEQLAVRASITPRDLQKTREKYGAAAPDARLLFHSGRLEPRKNFPILFEAIKLLKGEKKLVNLVLMGDGQDEQKLREMVRVKGIEDRVHFRGACYDEMEIGLTIAASDLSVVPGVVGLVAMHSFVYGTPILTRDNSAWLHCPEVEAVIEGRTGRYYRDGDVGDMVAKMVEMLFPSPCKAQMASACMEIIDKTYNPKAQERVIVQALNFCLPKEMRIATQD